MIPNEYLQSISGPDLVFGGIGWLGISLQVFGIDNHSARSTPR
jgi:hypothetical protein